MPHSSLFIPACADFWDGVARVLLTNGRLSAYIDVDCPAPDLSAVRVVVPGYIHSYYLRRALAARLQRPFLPPRMITLPAWLSMLPPEPDAMPPTSASERMMALYGELRQHGWLKKLFGARRNTDLLPLAQTLLALFDELTRALLPSLQGSFDAAEQRWHSALEQLSPPARNILSDEAQLVWTLWKSQLDGNDATAACFAQLMRLAARASEPLIWVRAARPDTFEQAFLDAYDERMPVLSIAVDWRAAAMPAVYARAWKEIVDGEEMPAADEPIAGPRHIALCPAGSLEEEAQRGAQTVLDWLQQGKVDIAIIAQDRVVARRMRALLERARVYVADETGWKLSTTRSAAAIAALLDVFVTRAETIVLLDLLKSPYVFPDMEDKADRVMVIEHALRRYNVTGGWEAATSALSRSPEEQMLLRTIAALGKLFSGHKTLAGWVAATDQAMHELGMRAALETDLAGAQVIALFDTLRRDCHALAHPFSFAEWRAFLSLQLESTPFVPADFDRRVVILQLNGMQLRSFDAVLMVGADADHLPSQLSEMLFFANGVRRELGLPTREERQCMQLRDFAEMLISNPEVVLSWQSRRDGEPNAISPWIERLQLTLERTGNTPMPVRVAAIPSRTLVTRLPVKPSPSAPQLLPRKLSASAYNSLVSCPYQFFVSRMLGLAVLDELSDMPEKRDYGEWLHAILKTYHETLRDRKIDMEEREALLRAISDEVFSASLDKSAAALGFYARWQKSIVAYLIWANDREAKGWRFVEGEKRFDKILIWEGEQITLHGCIDRIDENNDGERAVLDYKTKSLQALRERLKEGEDHQLAFYGLLSDLPVAHAHYVALEAAKDKTGDAPAQNFAQWQQALEARIVHSIKAIAAGAPLHASGIERVCVFCEMRGLCRKGAW